MINPDRVDATATDAPTLSAYHPESCVQDRHKIVLPDNVGFTPRMGNHAHDRPGLGRV